MANVTLTKKIKMIGIMTILLVMNTIIVYIGNGTSSVLPFLFFIPITFAARGFGAKGGLLVGIISGLLLGPFMPLDVLEQQVQPTFNWILRSIFFSIYGFAIGTFILRLKQQAEYDGLMGIPNRNHFYDYLTTELQKQKIQASKFYIILVNIDDFKNINDSIGHVSGDLLLISIKTRIKNCLKKNDLLARWSGDEFSIIVYRNNLEELTSVCNCIVRTLQHPHDINGQNFFIKASIGVSSSSHEHKSNEVLVKEAETAMRFVKGLGKNGYKFYTEEIKRNCLEEKVLEASLHKALETGQLELYYQPKVECKDAKIYGVEALVRWRRPAEGIIAPGVFIPIAEKTGLIIPIGNWVLKTACQQVKKWNLTGFANLCVSVNVSALQIKADDFVSTVASIIKEADIDPGFIELEITESSIMENSIDNIMKLNELKRIGVRISLDDFGKGYSSLNYLKMLPIDTLKVDKSFIQNIEFDPKEKVITEAIIKMSKALGLTVLAEGIENENQYLLLKKLNCDAMQGFYFSRPLPIEEMDKRLQLTKCS
ncbi:EAL domain-containing protein [Anaerobacillus sp. CMMVII]|uniref:EAL domain-containing protein n=1 Tax=Anaerobacillus sp. CMMVII TaxID=2755588 RepID=UPI0021B73C4D|nr:EAL domain-containing protein [Anaerobacillus sp. CMMVII]MCT8138590.1 EAL domain-containing protein [Anaerobacillus sp. CMMVII]